MSLHKLTAGDGYTYLVWQVAAQDVASRGYGSLGDYYSLKGESPGQWTGSGAAALGIAGEVSEAQMLALFGEGRHPDADAVERAVVAGGGTQRDADAASKLGRPFYVYADRPSEYRQLVAQRIGDWNGHKGLPPDWPVPAAEKARIRTEAATELFTEHHGRPPADGRELAGFIARESRAQTTAVAGYDLTFSPVKSVSALWAVAPRDVAERVRAAHDAAVADVIGWLEREATYTRTGRDGIRQVPVRGLIAAAFTHRDSRAGDPDLHTHVAVSNKVQTLDGRWLALDGTVLHKAAVAASERYNTRLQAHLTATLGVQFRATPTMNGKRPVREIAGLDVRLLQRWSTRRAAIEHRQADLSATFQRDHGRPPTAVEAIALAGQATLETRQRKHAPRSLVEQRHGWRAEAIEVLGSDKALRAMLDRIRTAATRRDDLSADMLGALTGRLLARVAEDRATWQVWHVRAEAERLVRNLPIPATGLDEVVDRIVTAALDPAHSVPITRPEPVAEPEPLRRPDGSSVYAQAGTQQYTSTTVLAAERSLIAASERHDGRVTDPQLVEVAVLESAANGVDLNPGQVQLVRELASSGARLQVAIAPAGTGKTTAMGVLARAWSDGGGHVLGLAPSAAAAGVLAGELGVRAETLAKLTYAIDTGDLPEWAARIGPATLVIVDEAGMAGSAQLARAVDFVIGRGGSVRLVADDRQLAAVGAGGVLRDITHTTGAVTLSHVVRFTDPAESAASLAIRGGDPTGIGYYLDQHRVHVGDTTTAADEAYAAWAADRVAGRDALLIAPTRDLVTALNARARTDRLAHQPASDATAVRLADGLNASAGDTIITRANDRRLALTPTDFVKNGDRWTIHHVGDHGDLTVSHNRLGIRIVLPAAYVREHVDLGYATTVHTAQGTTVDTCHAVVTGAEMRQMLYVALTRGRAANHLYVQTGGDGDPHTAIRPGTLRPPTAGDILTQILGRDGNHPSASTALREAADPARLLADAAARYTDALTVATEYATGQATVDTLAAEADRLHPAITASPAWPALRGSLAHIAATGRDPVRALRAAADGRDLTGAVDPAAVIAGRLQAGRDEAAGPLPWLPAIPDTLSATRQWGDYLTARARLITDLAGRVATHATGHARTTAPTWARPLLEHDQQLLADLAVWRSAIGVDGHDPRPTGPGHLDHRTAAYQRRLDQRIRTVAADPAASARQLGGLADDLDPRLLTDPYWPTLATRLATGRRAGIDTTRLARAAAATGPLPDEQPAAALWWRMFPHLSPAALADDTTTTSPLRPDWTPALTDILGAQGADQVLADPAWPAIVAAITDAQHQSGTHPAELLHTAAHGITGPDPQHTIADTLLWRVAVLTDPLPEADADWLPPPDHDDPADAWLPPTDHEPRVEATPDPRAIIQPSKGRVVENVAERVRRTSAGSAIPCDRIKAVADADVANSTPDTSARARITPQLANPDRAARLAHQLCTQDHVNEELDRWVTASVPATGRGRPPRC